MMSKSTKTIAQRLSRSRKDWTPRDYQKTAIKFLLENPCGGLFLDPGLGKTSITLSTFLLLKKRKLVSKMLVIAPLRVCYSVWPKEADKWEQFSGLKFSILHGVDKAKNLSAKADIFVINPEGLEWLLTKENMAKLAVDMLVIDESSKFKHSSTKRFKLLRPWLAKFSRRVILTGSPAANGLMDLFGQIYILDLGHALGAYITHYRSRFFYPSGYGGYDWKLQEGADQKIYDAIRPMTLRLSARDHLDLPEMVVNDIYVDLDKKSMALYKEMEKEFIIELRRGEVRAVNAAVATSKLRQIANGGVIDSEGKQHKLHDAKTDAVESIVEELGGNPALIAYEFHSDLQRLLDRFGKDTPYIGGGVSAKKSAQLELAWNRGELPILIGQPQSMGHGLNLQDAGNHVVWPGVCWSYENYDQFIKRVLRQGSRHEVVFVHRIVARGTIDEFMLSTLVNKETTQEAVFTALKNYVETL